MSRVRRCARALDAVFFAARPDAPDPPPRVVRRADTCMAGGLEVLDERFDDLGAALVTVLFQLLRAVRLGTLSRVRCRMSAEILLRHVAEVYAEDRGMVPLVELLGALASLPDGPDREDRFLDPTPDPDQPIEVALADALRDPDTAPCIAGAVARGRLYAPVLDLGVDDERLEVQFLPLVINGDPVIATFTSRERFDDHVNSTGIGDVPVIEIVGAELPQLCPPGHGVFVNPGSVLGHLFTEDEVRALAA
ncbi:MAG: SseB family protein [Acidimicrobiales bacterium]|nr:SseB family protein [Acidimicrobiales bacterium]